MEIVGIVRKISNKNNSFLIQNLKTKEEQWIDLQQVKEDSKNYGIGDIVLVNVARGKVKEVKKLYSQASRVKEEIKQSPEEIMFDSLKKVHDIYVFGELDKEFKQRIDWTKIVITLAIMKAPDRKLYK